MSDAEEYDPKTGTFRPIGKKPAPMRATTGRRPPPPPKEERERLGRMQGTTTAEALSQGGRGHDVAYDMFKGAFDSPSAKRLELGAKIVIGVIFLLLLWEAISYRFLGG